MKNGNCVICKIITVLVSVGAINWGLVAFFQMDLVVRILGPENSASKIVYGLIAVAGLIKLATVFGFCCPCSKKEGSCAK